MLRQGCYYVATGFGADNSAAHVGVHFLNPAAPRMTTTDAEGKSVAPPPPYTDQWSSDILGRAPEPLIRSLGLPLSD